MNESSPATAVSDRGSVGEHNGSQVREDDRRRPEFSADCAGVFGVDTGVILTNAGPGSSNRPARDSPICDKPLAALSNTTLAQRRFGG